MIERINNRDYGAEQYMSQYVQQMQINMSLDRLHNPSQAKGIEAAGAVGEVKKSEPNQVKTIIKENSTQAGGKTDVMSYFSRATGSVQERGEKGEKGQESGNVEKPARINTRDRVKISREARDEVKQEKEDPKSFFPEAENSIKMSMLNTLAESKIGEGKSQEMQVPDHLPLAEKLQVISMRTAGRTWS